ncbi:Long-chain-fatty-acid--CoA ligase [Sphingobium indicum BiD32]|uniref:Long-chain-fatty-acid--CoA ligase n=1 Tax=Sphingobium indicum BiD32 TaxID=1301087 RepID=N1MX19_9SPHN|nr:AMP-binding protein [Sphingobium indicum]CCW19808.1 Long-chain-fatty-acid--CoA ligase [Sphingobium indicum BiD32]
MKNTAGLTPVPRTIGYAIIDAALRWPDRTALVLEKHEASFAELARQVTNSARSLVGLGVRKGDHVGILMPNCWDHLVLSSALNLIGACAVVLNSRYRGDELRYVINHAEIKILFTSGAAKQHLDLQAIITECFPELMEWDTSKELQLKAAPKLQKVFLFDAPASCAWPDENDFSLVAAQTPDDDLARIVESVRPDDTAFVIFSSGTTALPKACMITHSSITHVSAGIAQRLRITADDVFWDPLPLYHLSSHLPLNACRQVGATYVCQTHFDASSALAELERVKATVCYPAFPALTAAMIDHPDFSKRDLSSLRIQLTIGAPDLLRRFANAIPQALQIACYGLTECGGICTMSSPDDTLDQRVERVGTPLPGFEVRIVDPDTLEEKPLGERGEILIRGPIFSGYFKDADQTAKVMLDDGWLRTGDAGWMGTDGQLVFSDRIKDMLKIGGENVAAAEVESFLAQHPKIKLAQVIPAPDDRLVEVVAAFIELNSGESMTAEEVINHCSGRIARYKVPRYITFVEEWPMSATKIQKFRLPRDFSLHAMIKSSGKTN